MSRAQGRRMEVRVGSGRAAVLGVMVVGLAFAMLTLSGTSPRGIGREVQSASRVSLDQRVFSCGGGISGAAVRSGSVIDGLSPSRAVSSTPVPVVADKAVATGAFAGQQASSKRSLAWLPCPEAQASWWFVAAGGAPITHDTVLTLTNPRPGPATVDIDVYGPKGRVDSPGLHGITIAAQSTQTVDLGSAAPTVGDLAVSVVAQRGLIAASATDRFAPGAVGKNVFEWLPPQTVPSTSVTLAGIPISRGASTLVVVNPGQVDAIVNVGVIGATGTFTPKALTGFTIAPNSVVSLPLSAVIDGTPLALQLTSQQPITATVRSTKAGDISFATGVRPIRGGTAFAVPNGSGQLVLSSLGAGATVTVVAFDAHGKHLLNSPVKVGAHVSVAVPFPAGTTYVQLIAGPVDIVAGFAVDGPHGTASAGITPAKSSIELPNVRPGL